MDSVYAVNGLYDSGNGIPVGQEAFYQGPIGSDLKTRHRIVHLVSEDELSVYEGIVAVRYSDGIFTNSGRMISVGRLKMYRHNRIELSLLSLYKFFDRVCAEYGNFVPIAVDAKTFEVYVHSDAAYALRDRMRLYINAQPV